MCSQSDDPSQHVTPQLTAENRKELLARLLRLGIDPSDFRVIGRALDDAADVDALRTEIGRKIDRLVEVEDRLAALLAARPASEETP